MSKKQDNAVLVRFTEDELKILNDGWYSAIAQFGYPITRTAYIKKALLGMKNALDLSAKMEEEAHETH